MHLLENSITHLDFRVNKKIKKSVDIDFKECYNAFNEIKERRMADDSKKSGRRKRHGIKAGSN